MSSLLDTLKLNLGVPQVAAPSAQLQPSLFTGGASRTFDTPTVTTPTPTLYGGTPKAQPTAAPSQPQQQSSGPSYQTPSMPSFEEVYAPLFASLTQQEGTAKSDYESVQASIERQQQVANEELSQAQESQNRLLTGQETDVEGQRMNALQQARQLYNELTQYNLARFGAGSSAGPAASEILGRETQRQFGNVEQTTAKAKADIEDKRYMVNRWTQLEQTRIKNQVEDKQAEARREYNNRLGQISATRYQMESQKVQNYYDAAAAYVNQIRQWETYKMQNILQLAVWNSQQQAALTKGLAEIPAVLSGDEMQSYFQSLGQAPTQLAQGASERTPTYSATVPTPATYTTKKQTAYNPLNPFENIT